LQSNRNYLLGIAAASAVVLIWSTWIVASRSGALSPLTIYDLAAMRYGISAVITLPFILWLQPWKTISVKRMTALTLLLSPVYILLVFGGFNFAPAAHAGIFMNGVLPVLTLAIGWLWLREKASKPQLAAASLILLATILVVADASTLSFESSWIGDIMFLIGGVFFTIYMIVNRLWKIKNTHVILCSAVINAIFYVPVWYFFLPSNLEIASRSDIALQAVYQGLVPNLVGLLLVAFAVRNIGSSVTSSFMAAVPGGAAILGFMFLGEELGWLSWLALALLTIGILTMTWLGQRQAKSAPSQS
jgi:drug/metabolite transporter (DMT)-like permease